MIDTQVNQEQEKTSTRFEKFKDWLNDLLNSDEKSLTEEEINVLNNLVDAETPVQAVIRKSEVKIEQKVKGETKDLGLVLRQFPTLYRSFEGNQKYIEFSGGISSDLTPVGEYVVKTGKVILIRRISIPYIDTNYSILRVKILIDDQNMLGEIGIINHLGQDFEHTKFVGGGSIIKLVITDNNATSNVTAVLEMIEFNSNEITKLLKNFK